MKPGTAPNAKRLPRFILMVAIAFAACSREEGAVAFTGVAEFRAWLDAQRKNTASAPYAVELNVGDISALRDALRSNSGKYVSLDLSGSTFTQIGNRAFGFCPSLTSITIPATVTKIDDNAFYPCANLASIHAAEANLTYTSIDGILYSKDKTGLVLYPAGKKGAFTIPDGVTYIRAWAFYGCSGLTSVTMPDSLTSIGCAAFSTCHGLKTLTIGNGVTSIDEWAFFNCKALASVTIGSNVKRIGEIALGGCHALTSVTFQSDISQSGLDATTFGDTINEDPPGDLREKYLAGGVGTYTRAKGGVAWRKQ
jgi:hypothetical protein